VAKVGIVRILHRASTISLQAAVHPKYTLGALNMKEEEEEASRKTQIEHKNCTSTQNQRLNKQKSSTVRKSSIRELLRKRP